AILERSASPRSYEHDRLPLSAAPATRSGETGKKTGSARRLSRAYPRYAPPSSRSSILAVADDVPSGPGTRHSSTRTIYQSSASGSAPPGGSSEFSDEIARGTRSALNPHGL